MVSGMQPSEALSVVAQVAVTLAGFAGIVVVFRPESIHRWSALDRFRLRLLLANSALPLSYSLFAIFLLTIDPPPAAIWRWCSGFAFATQLGFAVITAGPRRLIPAAEFEAVSKVMFYSVTTLGSIAMLLQVVNIALWNRFWPFFAAILVHLIAAIAQFVRMIVLSPNRG
jgi:hypothetical protein